MIAFKTIQTSFTATTKHAFFHTARPSNRKNSFLCLSKPNDDSNSEASSPEGDTRKQDLLARIAMLQAQKVRLTDYLDERSAYLAEFGEETNAEFDKIGEDALKGLDEASSRIMGNIESRMQAFESVESNKLEIVENENKLEEFEGQIENDRNEWLFFKNLRQSTPADKAKAKEETEKIKEVTKESAGSKTRRKIYLALIGLIVISIADSLLSSSSDWGKVAVLGAILVALLSQFIYEQRMSSETENTEKGKTEEEKK